jgi:hypothetical protein
MPGLRTFEGAVALVTGGASGIGAALGCELTRRAYAKLREHVGGHVGPLVAK